MTTEINYKNTARARSIPYISLLLGAMALILYGSMAPERLAMNLHSSSLKTLFTSHWVHWSGEHLLWSGGAFVFLGIFCESISRWRFMVLVLVSSIAVSIGVILFPFGLDSYAGLSGIDSALFGFVLFVHISLSKQRENKMAYILAMGVGLGFVAKLSYELFTGSAYFVNDTSDMVVVPVAHITGFILGCMFAVGHLRGCGVQSIDILPQKFQKLDSLSNSRRLT